MNCKNCANKDCEICGADNDLNNDCPNFKLPSSICPYCKKNFDKDKAKKYFNGPKMEYQCYHCTKIFSYERILAKNISTKIS